MKSTYARTRLLVFGGLLLLVLPLSWYCGKAETERIPAVAGSSAQETPKGFEEVEVRLKPGREALVGGKTVSLEDLGDLLAARFPSGRDNVLIRLSCEDDVTMEQVSEVNEIIIGLDLRKVIYEGRSQEGLPLVLPSLESKERLAAIADKHVAVVKVDLPGRVVLDGEPVKVTEVKRAIEERLAEDPHLVVSLIWVPTSSYEDFILVLGLVKAAGATRIAVQGAKSAL
jgi:biopolymer transport protein ExbD